MPLSPLVRVSETDRAGVGFQHELIRVAFGRPALLSSIRRPWGSVPVYHFQPGSVFCVVWWHRRQSGRQRWVAAIVKAPHRMGEGQPVPGITAPVLVHALFRQDRPAGGSGVVDRLLELIERMRKRGIEPSDVPEAFWRDAALCIHFNKALPEWPAVGSLVRRA